MNEITTLAGRRLPTYRKLDYWTRLGILNADEREKPGSGHPRHWSDAELQVAAVIESLRAAGLELPAAARAARQMCEHGQTELAPGLVLSLTDGATEAGGSHAA